MADYIPQVGDIVKVLAPFDVAFPGQYAISGFNSDTGSPQINPFPDDPNGPRDIDAPFLEKVTG